jgi:hypothetical protein
LYLNFPQMGPKLDLMYTEKILKAILQKVANQIQNKKLKTFEEIGEITTKKSEGIGGKKKTKKSCSSNYNGNSARKSSKNQMGLQVSGTSSTGFQFHKNLKKSKLTGKTCGDSMNQSTTMSNY